MRIPTFSRQSEPETAEAERPTPAGTTTATDSDPDRTEDLGTVPVRPRQDRTTSDRTANDRTTSDLPPAPPRAAESSTPPPLPPSTVARPVFPKSDPPRVDDTATGRTPVVPAGPKPRSSLLATLGLILGVAAMLLVLSGPLLGYGIGVAGVALVLSLSGIHATGKRHVAGKTDALIGMVLALGAIVIGVLALTGSLSWLGTDLHPVTSLREWLDTHTVNRF